ncbi:MAG: ATP-binding protein [Deltaproteobacteria bacterium]|nr:ATP-binding protein [Deltaproteobacteria bacterium]
MPLDPDLQERLRRVLSSLEVMLPRPVDPIDWSRCHAASFRRHALAGVLEPVPALDGLALADLHGIEEQKRVVEENTRQFVAGYPANNVLLWGTRGTGKSSLVRALLGTYAGEGLRIIQVDKDDLVHLPAIVDAVRRQPYRFVLFSDDVSFEVGESSYKMLKSALDGSVYAPPDNVLIYVTSNRRHMLPEFETDNLGALIHRGEIHHGEAAEEKISLSGRFGIWVAFHAFSREQYLAVARQWAEKLWERRGLPPAWSKEAEEAATAWSLAKGDQSGRIAYQFASHWVGRALLRAQGG